MTKANKKGFTLIELIIVIAILAILIAALSPLLIKWIERSRVSKDQSSLDNVYVAINTAIAKEDIFGYNTGDEWVKLSSLSSTSTGKALALYNELFTGNDATLDTKYQSANVAKSGDASQVFVSNDAADKIVWIAVTTSNKVLVCLAPDADDNNDTKIATEIGFVGNASSSDINW